MIKNQRIQIRKEFENYLQYWILHMFRKDQEGIFPEMSIDNIPNETADMGSMYLPIQKIMAHAELRLLLNYYHILKKNTGWLKIPMQDIY